MQCGCNLEIMSTKFNFKNIELKAKKNKYGPLKKIILNIDRKLSD